MVKLRLLNKEVQDQSKEAQNQKHEEGGAVAPREFEGLAEHRYRWRGLISEKMRSLP